MSDHHGVSAFPLPPMQYVRYCTDENMTNGIPAPPPTQENYMVFGAPFNVNDSIIHTLESQGLTQVYSENCNRKKEMKKLNHSILVSFLDLIDILILNPNSSARKEKLKDLHLLFINFDHLINELRPNQAREALRMMMMKQKHLTVELLNKFIEKLAEAKELIAKSIQNLQASNLDDCEAFKLSGLLEPGSCRLNDNIEMTSEYSVHDCTINTIKYLNKVCNVGREDSPIQSEVEMENIDCKSKVLDAQENNRDASKTGEKEYFNSKSSVRNTADFEIENEDILTIACANKNQNDMESMEGIEVTTDDIGLSNSLLATKNGGQLALCEVEAMEEDIDLSQCKQDVINNNKTCIDVTENKECGVKLERKSKESCHKDIGSFQSKSVDVCFSQGKQGGEDVQSKQEAERSSSHGQCKHETGDDLPLLQIRQGREDVSLEQQAKDDVSLVQSKRSVDGDVSLMQCEQGGESNLQCKQGDVLFMQSKEAAESDSRLISPNQNLEDDTQLVLHKQEGGREMLFEEKAGNLNVMENRKWLARHTNVEESKEEISDKNIVKNKKEIYDDTNVRKSKREIADDTNMGESKEKDCGTNVKESKKDIRETKEVINAGDGVLESMEEMACDKILMANEGEIAGDISAVKSQEETAGDRNVVENQEAMDSDMKVMESQEERDDDRNVMESKKEWNGDINMVKSQEEMVSDAKIMESQELSKSNITTDDVQDNVNTLQSKCKHDDVVGLNK